MKTANQWTLDLQYVGEDHSPACICKRCKNGRETFLLAEDVEAIQSDARAELLEELKALRKAIAWLNTPEGMDWFSHCDYGQATLAAITAAMKKGEQ